MAPPTVHFKMIFKSRTRSRLNQYQWSSNWCMWMAAMHSNWEPSQRNPATLFLQGRPMIGQRLTFRVAHHGSLAWVPIPTRLRPCYLNNGSPIHSSDCAKPEGKPREVINTRILPRKGFQNMDMMDTNPEGPIRVPLWN